MDADVPKASLPAQAGVRPKANAMSEQAAAQDHKGHEITAAIKGAAPADQHHDGAQKQKQKMPEKRELSREPTLKIPRAEKEMPN